MKELVVIDASEGILGRVAAFAAKQALLGKEVKVVNSNEVLISGNRRDIIQRYVQKATRGGSSQNGPNFPTMPERIMKRTIRGMLSHRQGRGNDAFKRVRCYNKVPVEFKDAKKISLKREIKVSVIKLSEISKEIR
jgi:large subunit ribosomal protein L13